MASVSFLSLFSFQFGNRITLGRVLAIADHCTHLVEHSEYKESVEKSRINSKQMYISFQTQT